MNRLGDQRWQRWCRARALNALSFAKAAEDEPQGQAGGPYMFLRNEPNFFSSNLLCIRFTFRYLCSLWVHFLIGFVLENEPKSGGVLRPYDRKLGGFGSHLRGSEGVLHCAGQGKGAAILLWG